MIAGDRVPAGGADQATDHLGQAAADRPPVAAARAGVHGTLLAGWNGAPRRVAGGCFRGGLSPPYQTLDHVQFLDLFWNPFSNQYVHQSGAWRERQYIDALKTLAGTPSDTPGECARGHNPKNWISNQ